MSVEPGPSIASKSRDVRQRLVDLTSYLAGHQHDGDDRVAGQGATMLDALERFTLWAGNMGAMHSRPSKLSLDQRLAPAPEVHELVCQLLDDLTEALDDLSSIVTVESKNRETACDIGYDDEGTVQVVPSDDETATQRPTYEATMILEIISECISSLFRTGILIRKAGPTDRFSRALQMSTSAFYPSFDIDYVREKYPKLKGRDMKGLSERLGNAISKRRQFIKYSRDHKARLAYEDLSGVPEDFPARTEQLSSKATSLHPEKLPAHSLLLAACEEDEEDVVSVISASTLSGSASTLKLPRLEELKLNDGPFECPICFTLQYFRREKAWRIHAFRDLKAYICTIGGKDCESELFGDRNSWFEHEIRHHRAQHTCILCPAGPFSERCWLESHINDNHGSFLQDQLDKLVSAGRKTLTQFRAQDCPFCNDWAEKLRIAADPKGKGSAEEANRDVPVSATRFKRHVAVHQEQLAIFAMPRAVEDNGTPDSGSVGSLSAVKSLPKEVIDTASEEVVAPGYQNSDSEHEQRGTEDSGDGSPGDDSTSLGSLDVQEGESSGIIANTEDPAATVAPRENTGDVKSIHNFLAQHRARHSPTFDDLDQPSSPLRHSPASGGKMTSYYSGASSSTDPAPSDMSGLEARPMSLDEAQPAVRGQVTTPDVGKWLFTIPQHEDGPHSDEEYDLRNNSGPLQKEAEEWDNSLPYPNPHPELENTYMMPPIFDDPPWLMGNSNNYRSPEELKENYFVNAQRGVHVSQQVVGSMEHQFADPQMVGFGHTEEFPSSLPLNRGISIAGDPSAHPPQDNMASDSKKKRPLVVGGVTRRRKSPRKAKSAKLRPTRSPAGIFRCKSCNEFFLDADHLQVHVQKAHARPLVCVFGYAGCTATFSSKNEWKRHIIVQHIILLYWLCTEVDCVRANPATGGTVFNRKDLYTQHVRRMHIPEAYREFVERKEHHPDWDRTLRSMQDNAERKRCELPTYMECPAVECSAEFRGATAWDDRMEHVASHLDSRSPDEPTVVFGGDEDWTLTEWATRPDVNIVRRIDDGDTWELVVPLKTTAKEAASSSKLADASRAGYSKESGAGDPE